MRQRRSDHSTAAVPVEESLCGLGPIPASNANVSEQPHVFGSVIDDSGGGRLPSRYWQYVYPLKSNIQPDSYTLEGLPDSKDQPDCKEFPYVGCPLCNAPPTTTTACWTSLAALLTTQLSWKWLTLMRYLIMMWKRSSDGLEHRTIPYTTQN
jgi:hypothetical protein